MNRTARPRLRSLPGATAVLDRLDRALRWRIDEAVQPLQQQISDLHSAADDARGALTEVRRMAPQLAAVEERLAELSELLTRAAGSGPEEAPKQSA